MQAKTPVEVKELLKLDQKQFMLALNLQEYKDNVKALKICAKLVKLEINALKNSKAPVPESDLQAVKWRYDDLAKLAKALTKASDAVVYGKAAEDLAKLVANVEKEIGECELFLAPPPEEEKTVAETIKEEAHVIKDKVTAGAQKVGEFLSDKVGKLKKALTGDDDSE